MFLTSRGRRKKTLIAHKSARTRSKYLYRYVKIQYEKTIKRFLSSNFFAAYLHSSRVVYNKNFVFTLRLDLGTMAVKIRRPGTTGGYLRYQWRRTGFYVDEGLSSYGGREKGCDATRRSWRLTNFTETEGERLQNQKKPPYYTLSECQRSQFRKNKFFFFINGISIDRFYAHTCA